ncbi:zincin-like metallopeptidase domain-containing protein [Lactococcus garvieae]|uniref:zincin-like metallopeptidase domain-containing protein n=1 Tax=Lactococcus garvieae TaxID=1363 RepID=UPI003250423F
MEEIHLEQAFLGFIPNMTEKRKVVEQRKAQVLERVVNHAKFFDNNEDKLVSVYSKKEHVARLVLTSDYKEKSPNFFEKKERPSNSRVLTDYFIKGHAVSATEFEFGQHLYQKFWKSWADPADNLNALQASAKFENEQIEATLQEKSSRIQKEHNKRLCAQEEQRIYAIQQLEAMEQGKTRGKEEEMAEYHTPSTRDEQLVLDKGQRKSNLETQDLARDAIEQIKNYCQKPEDVKAYLDFMGKFPELSPRNLALLESQWPGANMIATYNQWSGKTPDEKKKMGRLLDVKKSDIDAVTRTLTDKKTGTTKTVVLDQLSVRQGEKAKISLIRVQEDRYFEKKRSGQIQAHWEKFWSKEEKARVEAGQIKTKSNKKYVPYKVFELSQTNIKPECLPKLLPNRHINFEAQPQVLKSMEAGLNIYAHSIGVTLQKTAPNQAHMSLGNAKGAASLDGKSITMNHLNTPTENVTTLIHELAHSTLHKEGSSDMKSSQYAVQEFEAEMTSYVVAKRYGIDTSEKAIPYIAGWTDKMKGFEGVEGEKLLNQSLARVQKASHDMIKRIDGQVNPQLKQEQKRQQASMRQGPMQMPQGQKSTPSLGR